MPRLSLNGIHLMLDLSECGKKGLENKQKTTRFLKKLPKMLGMRMLEKPRVITYKGGKSWDKGGITGFVLIAESHISIHTFPEYGFLTADVYSCKPFNTKKAIQIFKREFLPKKEKTIVVERELRFIREKALKKSAAQKAT